MRVGKLFSPTWNHTLLRQALFVMLVAAGAGAASAQSTLQEFPTPVEANLIEGTIEARVIGDSRLTSYYYVFDATQGDMFVNVVTENFAGDIDLFFLNGLRPISKIVLYADAPVNETGRAVYFRRTERLLLRVQGRTPNDDPAKFTIKFAGSFAAVNAEDFPEAPELPTVRLRQTDAQAATSAGTLIPKPTPNPEEVRAAELAAEREAEAERERTEAERVAAERVEAERIESEREVERRAAIEKEREEEAERARRVPEVVITQRATLPPVVEPVKPEPAADPEVAAVEAPDEPVTPEPPTTRRRAIEASGADPAASLSLVVVFRNGGVIRRPMPEVSRFLVDRGVLTIISQDGKTGRYPMAEVLKVTIE